MKICIITNYRNTLNYGAILQAYALNKYLRNQNFECETLNYSPKQDMRYIISRMKKPLVLVRAVANRFKRMLVKKKIQCRAKQFDAFRNNEIPHTKPCNQYNVEEIENEFDVLICGSDQIWRPGLIGGRFDDVNWLKISADKKKISYAASLGIDKLNEDMKIYAKDALSDFHAVSVREESAKQLLSDLYQNGNIQTVIDPVLLLNQSEWDDLLVGTTPINIPEDYLFVYFINPESNAYKKIKKYARKNSLKIVSFPYMASKFDKNDHRFADVEIYDAAPEQFIYCIKNAKCVITDSFHATVLSVIYQKEFYVFVTNHGTRLRDLLKKCNLSNRCIDLNNDINDSIIRSDQWEICYNNLRAEINKSKEFLETSLASDSIL